MTKDVPKVFKGIVEVDETYLGGQWKNKRLSIKYKSPKAKRGRGTSKQAVFGILCRNGRVWAELIDGVEAGQLLPHIVKKVKKGSIVFSDTWRGYTGIAAKGYVHRLVKHSKDNFVSDGNHINGLEGFRGYLKRKLVAKGGIRRSRLHLYVGEYVWRYNNRNLNLKEQELCLLKLLNHSVRYGFLNFTLEYFIRSLEKPWYKANSRSYRPFLCQACRDLFSVRNNINDMEFKAFIFNYRNLIKILF